MRLLFLALLLLTGARLDAAVPRIAAASDLRFAMAELTEAYARETGRQVKLSYGSSGVFRQQIAGGAPFELFLSADEAYVLALAKAGFTRDTGAVYARGRLVLFVPAGGRLAVGPELAGLRAALAR